MNWYLEALGKSLQFSGRSRRMEYWMFTLIHFIVVFALVAAAVALADSIGMVFGVILALYALVTIFTQLSLTIRRLHDTNRSGLWVLISFIPFGGLVLFIFMLIEGTSGSNDYGPDPK